jgi:hypothetical protein
LQVVVEEVLDQGQDLVVETVDQAEAEQVRQVLVIQELQEQITPVGS